MNAHVETWLTTDATPVHGRSALSKGGSLASVVLVGQICIVRITLARRLIQMR